MTGDNEVELRPEAFSLRLRRAMLIGGFGVLLGYISTGFQRALLPLLAPLALYWVVLAVVLLATDRMRRRSGTSKLRFADDGLYVPGRYSPSRMTVLRYENIRAANEVGRGWLSSFAIDAGERLYAVPLARLGEDGVARLGLLLRSKIENLPDGAARWARIAHLRARAAELRGRSAWATWTVAALVVLAFGWQLVWPRIGPGPADGFAPLDLGANASALVAHGQWWRLVTGNLLHASPQHVVNNVVFLLIFGTLLERIAGPRVFLLVLLATGIAAEAASAALAPHVGFYLFSVGISGALAGLVGALGALTLLHWRDMPAGFRLPRQSWVVLLGLNLIIAFSAAAIDHIAHAGGLLAGLALGWVLTLPGPGGMRPSLASLRTPGPVAQCALAGLLLAWIAGVTAQLAHSRSAAARLGDRVVLVRDQLAQPRAGALAWNSLAYAVALNPGADPAALRDARQLAALALAQVVADKNTRRYGAAVADTEAVLDDRLGETGQAVRMEALLLPRSYPVIAEHLAHMLEKLVAGGGPVLVGTGVAPPALRLENGTMRFDAPAKIVRGGRVIALLRRDGAVLGLVNLYVPPDYDGETVLPLPVRYGAPVTEPPDAMWLDGRSVLELALFDSTGCRCRWPSMAPEWHELPHGGAAWP